MMNMMNEEDAREKVNDPKRPCGSLNASFLPLRDISVTKFTSEKQ